MTADPRRFAGSRLAGEASGAPQRAVAWKQSSAFSEALPDVASLEEAHPPLPPSAAPFTVELGNIQQRPVSNISGRRRGRSGVHMARYWKGMMPMPGVSGAICHRKPGARGKRLLCYGDPGVALVWPRASPARRAAFAVPPF